MEKERFLTILVPITDADIEPTTYPNLAALMAAVPVNMDNVDKIYKVEDGTYYRLSFNTSSGEYGYQPVIDREFPYLGKPLEIFNFTYNATRMGTAPTISAQGVMWFADRNVDGKDVTLERLWTQECHVTFNGDNFYLKQIPTSSKSNKDARYKYDIDFVSERVILERIYIYDVVSPFITEKPISESSSFSFYGDINELAKRINASLIKSGLASLKRKYVLYPNGYNKYVPLVTYEQWNQIGIDPSVLLENGVFESQDELSAFYEVYKNYCYGDYNVYLMEYIYENTNGVYDLVGYQCKIGKDKKGDVTTSDEKLISFEDNTIHDALQEFHDTFKLQYYISKEKNGKGVFTGNTIIWVADCEHDFADMDYILLTSQPSDWDTNYSNYYKIVSGEYTELSSAEPFAQDTYYKYDFVRDEDGVPTTESPFDYGVEDALLSKEKANTTDKIVTRITGVGSTENIPWYYPNPNPDGWIKPVLKVGGEEQSSVIIDYPTSEGNTLQQSTRYERYLKNRIGNPFTFGNISNVITQNDAVSYTEESLFLQGVNYWKITINYRLDTNGVTNPRMTLKFNRGFGGYFTARLSVDTFGTTDVIGFYDSRESYQNPTDFQILFSTGNQGNYIYTPPYDYVCDLQITLFIPKESIPYTEEYDYYGHRYTPQIAIFNVDVSMFPYTDSYGVSHVLGSTPNAHIGENFYKESGLYGFGHWAERTRVVYYGQGLSSFYVVHDFIPDGSGFSTNGNISGNVSPLPRRMARKYKDVSSGKVYICTTSATNNPQTGHPQHVFSYPVRMYADELISKKLAMKISLFCADGWYLGKKKVRLSEYGINGLMKDGVTYSPNLFDKIDFVRVKYVTPQQNLMPEVYIKTDGERRFYNAHNYWDEENETLFNGTADAMIGEVQVGSKVANPIYKENETDPNNKHYHFENEYIQSLPHEHIENFDDVKPTIFNQKNYIRFKIDMETFNGNKTFFYIYNQQVGNYVQCTQSSVYDSEEDYYALVRIDVIEEFAYDETDNDEVWETNENGSVQGEYKHPYFFARLRPLGFNIFDLALQEDMVLSMTTGNCGACNFKIGVDENTNKNPVQVWEYNVYGGGTYETKGEKIYSRGDIRRYVDTSGLYYDTNGQQSGYHLVDSGFGIIEGGSPISEYPSSISMFNSYVYSSSDVENGHVGSMKQEGKLHFEGDVVTSGRFLEEQQDTTSDFVWVALLKDVETYGTIMPAARPYYDDNQFDVYIRPKSISDVHSGQSFFDEDEENADKFVFTNIRMPQVYLRRAERDLSRMLVASMYDKNYQKFNFSIKFSRIFLAKNTETDQLLNENSVLYVTFNNKTYRQYVKNYSYKMSKEAVLPEISVDMNEELNVSMTAIQRQAAVTRKNIKVLMSHVSQTAQQVEERISKKTVSKNGNSIIGGNIISRSSGTSLIELANASRENTSRIENIDVKIDTEYYSRKDFKVENGSDLNIGGEVVLPTLRKSGGILYRRKWDAEMGEFVFDDSEVFAPAFIDNTDKRLLDYHGEYELLASEPYDFTTNYKNYFKIVNGVYTALIEAETFAANTYYRYVDSVENNSITPARVSAGQINYGPNGVIKPLYMSSNKISEKNYELLGTQPSDWGSARANYYEKDSNGDYVKIDDSTTAFIADKFYKEVSTEYSVASTDEYKHIVQAFDQIDIALHCAQVTITPNMSGGYDGTVVFMLPEARQNPDDERPSICPASASEFWFRTTT